MPKARIACPHNSFAFADIRRKKIRYGNCDFQCFKSDLNTVAMEPDHLVTIVVRTARSLIASIRYAKSVKKSVDTKLARAVIELYLFKVRDRIRTGLHRPLQLIMTVLYTTVLRRCRPSFNFPDSGTLRISEWH